MRISKGFNEIPSEGVRVTGLQVNDDYEDPEALEVSISHRWVADSPTEIVIQAEIDLALVERVCRLAPDEVLLAIVRTYCKSTMMQHCSEPVRVEASSFASSIIVPRFEWADQATVKLSLVVANVARNQPLAGKAVIEKSRLFEKSWSIVLSGSYSRADVQSVSFASLPTKHDAFWEIEVSALGDLESWILAEQSTVLHVRLNEKVLVAFESHYVEALMKVDVIMASLAAIFDADLSASDRDELIKHIAMPPDHAGSWLKFLSAMFHVAFPNGTIGAAQFWRSRTSEIRTHIQSYVGKM